MHVIHVIITLIQYVIITPTLHLLISHTNSNIKSIVTNPINTFILNGISFLLSSLNFLYISNTLKNIVLPSHIIHLKYHQYFLFA